jgi:lipopolysaccharide transport system ATP-binding protein
MSDVAIKVEDVGKLYRLGEVGTGTLGQDLKRWWTVTRGKEDPFAKIGEANDRTTKGSSDFVWALKNINFKVNQGEVLGIIGKNGAGKSTLLKLLSKVTQPTTGNIKVKGRIASLLEVGTGFHPDLTGKENIFLNGAILGMTKKEIRRKFEEIVDFSGVERYIDTPVKRYSSGMYVRLAFAVAAHLESEILIVDEVLAVGDAEFQEKCLGKMGNVSKTEGRTVLYVSHQMGTVAQLCTKAIMMDKGTICFEGTPNVVIDQYHSKYKSKSANYKNEFSNNDIFIKNAIILNENKEAESVFMHDEKIEVKVHFKVNNWIRGAEARMIIRDSRNINVFTADIELNILEATTKEFSTIFQIPSQFLRPKAYSVTLALFIPNQYYIELLEDIINFTVNDGGTKYAQSEEIDYGPVFSPCKTQIVDVIN